MKKLIIGALVSSLILFIWQFLSWSQLNIHQSQYSYTPNQEAILKVLGEQLQPGSYFLPTHTPDATAQEKEALMKSVNGKPWATISYHSSFSSNMGMNMFRGWLANLIAALLLCWLLLKITNLDFKTALLVSLAVGLIGYLLSAYMDNIWFEMASIPDLIDTIVQWGLVGLWLGWWLTRNKSTA